MVTRDLLQRLFYSSVICFTISNSKFKIEKGSFFDLQEGSRGKDFRKKGIYRDRKEEIARKELLSFELLVCDGQNTSEFWPFYSAQRVKVYLPRRPCSPMNETGKLKWKFGSLEVVQIRWSERAKRHEGINEAQNWEQSAQLNSLACCWIITHLCKYTSHILPVHGQREMVYDACVFVHTNSALSFSSSVIFRPSLLSEVMFSLYLTGLLKHSDHMCLQCHN